jgi:hypothetical protein
MFKALDLFRQERNGSKPHVETRPKSSYDRQDDIGSDWKVTIAKI